MSNHRTEIQAVKVGSIGKGTAAITLNARITQGPVNITGRNVSTFLADSDIGFIMSTLASMPVYRDIFRVIADELDARDAIRNADGTAPVRRMEYDLNSPETHAVITALVRNTVDNAALTLG